MRIFQARMLEWIAISHSWDTPDAGMEVVSLVSPALEVGSLLLCYLGNPNIAFSALLGF